MGLGLLGRGVGDAKFLAKMGADLIVTDLKPAKDLASSLKKLRTESRKLKAITYVLGRHRLEDFQNRDLIIRGADVPFDSPFIAEAKKNKIPVVMSTALFSKFAQSLGAKIIGITGTRGKTTVTMLIYEILRRFRIGKVWLGGNVQNVSTLALLPRVKPGDWVVLELDSWQLQGFRENKLSPSIAVFTNFLPDHLNYYRGDWKRYFEDKANIYKFQKKEDTVFVNREIAKKIKSPGRKIIPPSLPSGWKLNLAGKHNRNNAGFAVAVARKLSVPDDIIKKELENFRSIPGRLEFLRTSAGVKFYNDTTSTTPDALRAGLEALGGKGRKIILIMGGADKKLDMGRAIEAVRKYCRAVILLPGTGTDKLPVEFIEGSRAVKTLPEAVALARNLSRKGDIVLLSPGFASFGLFKNEFDRGKKFNRLVKNL